MSRMLWIGALVVAGCLATSALAAPRHAARHRAKARPAAEGKAATAKTPAGKATAGGPTSDLPAPRTLPDVPFAPLRVALDPGHGGLSTGAMGVAGIYEKHVTLALARRVQALLVAQPGIQVVLTRDADEDVDLAARPARAAAGDADILVSLHANASPQSDVRGVETYYLGPASDPGADEVSRRENAEAVTPGPLADDPAVAAILSDLRRNGNLSESASLAEAIHQRLAAACPDTPSRLVRQGNFAVLRRASMPAVVVEIGFLTHPVEGQRLVRPAYQERLAVAIRDGILEFARRPVDAHAALGVPSGRATR